MTSMTISRVISTVGYVGYAPFAPGTFGTFAGLVFMVILKPHLLLHIFLTCFFIAAGVISAGHEEKAAGRKDPQHIVIDEFAGYMVSLLFLPLSWNYIISAFILFRFFDIIKLPPIKKLGDRFEGGIGIMIDDIVAGIYTNLMLQAWRLLS